MKGSRPPGESRSILLDIEGTTTPIAFVYRVLFPYAHDHVAPFLLEHQHEPAVEAAIGRLRAEASSASPPDGPAARVDASVESIVEYVRWAIERDRKTTALKALQGLIWEEGYRSGALHGEVFPDVPGALERWHRTGIDVRTYSSGSVLAQRLLFATVRSGDLTPFVCGFFDTQVGAKTEPASYARIAAQVDSPPAAIIFVSDVVGELDAARSAGLSTRLAVRPGNPPQPPGAGHVSIFDFESPGL